MPFRWLFEEGQKSEVCIDVMDYESWLKFVFDHPEPKKDQDRWYSLDGAEAFYFKDSLLFLQRLTRLMQAPELLLSHYSIDQVKQGFWCFITAFELNDVLEDRHLDFEARRSCVHSFDPLYQKLFSRPGFEKLAFNYWDPLTYSFYSCQGRGLDADMTRVQGLYFETLMRLLRHKSRASVLGAIRGLAQLQHPQSQEAIRERISQAPELSDEDRSYALACLRGQSDLNPPPRLD